MTKLSIFLLATGFFVTSSLAATGVLPAAMGIATVEAASPFGSFPKRLCGKPWSFAGTGLYGQYRPLRVCML